MYPFVLLGLTRYLSGSRPDFLVCGVGYAAATPPYVNHKSRAGQPGCPERPMIRAQALDRVFFNLHSLP